MRTIILDGERFGDIPSFYEEINRLFMSTADWKLGQTLDGFHDLLYGGIGVLEPRERFRLVWLHTSKSREDLGFDATLEYYQNKLQQPQTFNVQWVEEKIANLENGSGPTYFEILVEIIESHENVYFSPYD